MSESRLSITLSTPRVHVIVKSARERSPEEWSKVDT